MISRRAPWYFTIFDQPVCKKVKILQNLLFTIKWKLFLNLHRNEVDIVKIMTFESSGSENHITTSPPDEALETNPRVSEPEKTRQNDINIEKKNENVVSSPEHDGATCNGYSSVGHNTKNAPPNSSSNLNNLRKTLAKWLRPKNKSKKPTQR